MMCGSVIPPGKKLKHLQFQSHLEMQQLKEDARQERRQHRALETQSGFEKESSLLESGLEEHSKQVQSNVHQNQRRVIRRRVRSTWKSGRRRRNRARVVAL